MTKTLVELFDESNIENVISALALRPERILFIGFGKNMKIRKRAAIDKLFKEKGLNIKTEYVIVSRFDYQNILQTLTEICDKNEDVCFDLTGGRELVLLAMGEVASQRNIPLIQYDIMGNKMIGVKNCPENMKVFDTTLSVEESVILNGGKRIGESKRGILSKEMCTDIEKMWRINQKNSGLWNRQITELEKIYQLFPVSDDEVFADLSKMRTDVFLNHDIIKELCSEGLILDYSLKDNILKYRYKNSGVHHCMSKAGNILELYGYMLLCFIMEKEGKYTDIDTSIMLDWDGDAGEGNEGEYETTNEVDIIVMKHHNSVFISCKNGEVNKEALYELSSVAEHFGGEYAKKILLASYVCADEDKEKYLRQRATDMKIDVIYDVHKMSREELLETLKKRI